MGRSYVVLVNPAKQTSMPCADQVAILQAAGMQLRTTFGSVSVFASADTPSLLLPNGGVIVGELFSHDGEAIRDTDHFLVAAPCIDIRSHILSSCWGDYILVQPEADRPGAVYVMRSPSHACELQCIYSLQGGQGFLTSDILLATRIGIYRKRVDFDYIAHRLNYPDLKTSRTGLADISELLPGCSIHWLDGDVRTTQDWNPWDFVVAQTRYLDPNEAAAALRTAVTRVVTTFADRDKTILLELSGGLDSSIVGACLRHSQAQVTCRTLKSPIPGSDEREYASLIAGMLGVELWVTEIGYNDAPPDFSLPAALVTPAVGPLQHGVDRIMEAAATRDGANSFFSGAGGDTVFCYLTSAAPAADAFREEGLTAAIQAIGDISTFHQCTYWKAGRLTLRSLLKPKLHHATVDRTFLPSSLHIPEPELHPWLLSQPPGALVGDSQRIFELSAAQFFRDSCPRSLARPVRMPLLSQPVIETCLKIPSWMWFSGGQNRSVARLAFANALPPKILARKSKGTFTTYLGALYRRKKDAIVGFLLDGELQAHGLLDVTALRRLLEGSAHEGDTSFMRVFQLCAIENWVRQQAEPTARSPIAQVR